MRVVIQRVKHAQVLIDQKEKRSSGPGLLVLLGIEHADEEADVFWLVNKVLNLRIFEDAKIYTPPRLTLIYYTVILVTVIRRTLFLTFVSSEPLLLYS